jgi:hypothetical protein
MRLIHRALISVLKGLLMNKAITEGLVLTPPPFANGLEVWSRGDGTPGSATYDGFANAAFVPADQDFGGCLEIQKTEATQRLRYMGETPLLPGCYLRIRARIKAVSGNLPGVRVSGFAGGAGGNAVAGAVTGGPSVTITSYGDIVEVSAIVGTGTRPGVDLAWGANALYGHFGIELTGANGGVVRVDDIEIEDITSAFLRTMMDWVDVKDHGAIGDGVTDNVAAFEAADAAAQASGRSVLVSDGTYALGDNVSFEARVRFQGTLSMSAAHHLLLRENFNLSSYIDAFGSEELGFAKAFQALVKGGDHESLDLGGRTLELSGPLDMRSFVPDEDTLTGRRIIKNGKFTATPNSAWDTETSSSQGTYDVSNPYQLSGVGNVANVDVGARVLGSGVGREVYVLSKNVGAQTLELSNPLFDAVGTQNYSFARYKYLLDFSGFESISRLGLTSLNLECSGEASAVMLSKQGLIWHFRDCDFNRPKDRGITSIGKACQGMLIDRCQFISNEQSLKAQDRNSIGFNVNANDAKIRNNRAVRFAHFAVVNGAGHMVQGNHWFQGDNEVDGMRQAGLVLTNTSSKSVINGNYVDNNFIEWTNEHDAEPDHSNEFSFGSLSIVGNIFTAKRVGSWFRYIVIKPCGPNHFINGLNVSGNTFRIVDGSIDRVEKLDDSIAGLDFSRMRNINWADNTYHSIDQWTASPVMLDFSEATPASTWDCDFSDWLPFGGRARNVSAVMAEGPLRNGANAISFAVPYCQPEQGSGGGQVNLIWPQPVRGKVNVTARVDSTT